MAAISASRDFKNGVTDIEPAVRDRLLRCSAATISTLLVKRGLRNTVIRGVRPLHADLTRLVGPAFTLRYIPAREDIDAYGSGGSPDNVQRQVIEIAPPGSVLVIDCREETAIAGIGAILARRLLERGVAGVVLDGGVRDTTSVSGFGLPVYCSGPAAPPNYTGHHAADYGLSVACGGVPVYPDDVILGDAEAVVVIPRHLAGEVAEEGEAMERREAFLMTEIEAGRPIAGVYPPDAATLARYQAALASGAAE